MKSLFNSFAFRMWILFSIAGLLLSIPLSYYYSNINYKLLEKHAKTELEAMAKSSSLSIELAIKSNDFQIIEETINQISNDNRYAFIAILEQDDDAEESKLFKCFPDSLTKNRPFFDSVTYYLNESALETEIIKGKIIIGISKTADAKKLQDLNKPILHLTILANLILLVLSSLFFLLITNPLRTASRFAAELSKENYTSELTWTKGKNEISVLNNSLNTLKKNLMQHKETNDGLVKNLEQSLSKEKVRTIALVDSENKLKVSLLKEKELGELKTSFVSMASHQFRTPLSVIQANTELFNILASAGKKIEPEKSEKITGRIKNEIIKMTELMDEVLILGKLTSGNIHFAPKEIDIINFCNQLVEEFNLIQDDGRTLDFKFEGDPYTVNLDPRLLTHTLSNLISNAFKYSVGKKNPELTIHFKPKELLVSIKDYGLGIPKAELSNLFQPFFRANNVTDIKGSGLGLNIAKEYVEINKGEIAVKSTLGEGSCFEIKFKH